MLPLQVFKDLGSIMYDIKIGAETFWSSKKNTPSLLKQNVSWLQPWWLLHITDLFYNQVGIHIDDASRIREEYIQAMRPVVHTTSGSSLKPLAPRWIHRTLLNTLCIFYDPRGVAQNKIYFYWVLKLLSSFKLLSFF